MSPTGRPARAFRSRRISPADDAMYPALEPDDDGYLDVGDGNTLYWCAAGNPSGIPVVVLHGGPGSGMGRGNRRGFDPQRYRIINFDQRGCGRSTPHAADPATDIASITTAAMIADIERLREHHGFGSWAVFGGSWGSTLAVAYAQAHPTRVRGLALVAVTLSRPSEIDWLYQGSRRFFPAQWEEFVAASGVTYRGDIVEVLRGYADLVASPDRSVAAAAAARWCAWEDALISGEVDGNPGAYSAKPDDARIAMVRICAQVFGNRAWMGERQLLDGIDAIKHLPAELVHGAHDISGPPITAWEIARRWPAANLHLVDAGHTGNAAFGATLTTALDRLADRMS